VTLAEQLEEAEELARVVRVLEILGLRRAVGHSETFGLVAPLERIEIQHAATDHTTLTVHVNFYLLFAHCRPNCTVVASRLTKAPICSFKVNFRVLTLKLDCLSRATVSASLFGALLSCSLMFRTCVYVTA